MYYVYMIRCTDNSIYTGTAKIIEQRLEQHFQKSQKRAKYTKSHTPQKVEVIWKCNSKSDALKLEYRLKQLTKPEKEKLINENIAPESICLKLQGMIFDRIDVNSIIFDA